MKANLKAKKSKIGESEELPLKRGDVFETPDGRKWKYAGGGTAKPIPTLD